MGGTKQGSGSGIKSILVTAGIALMLYAGFMANGGRVDQDDDLTEQVTLTVTFKPPTRTDAIHVQAHVDNVEVENTLVVRSPYTTTITVPKGAEVWLYALQDNAGELTCTITVRGTPVDAKNRKDPGSVRCAYNRKS